MPERSICIYCGSSKGTDPAFAAAAEELGQWLADQDVGLVYGGGRIGLMGICARAVLAAGGHVTGIIPDFLQVKEIAFDEVSELHVVNSMHERKHMMFERSDAFIALPGGIGTLEETIEMITWAQLGRHTHPIILLNISGFWDPLISLLDHMKETGFLSEKGIELFGTETHDLYTVVNQVSDLLPALGSRFQT